MYTGSDLSQLSAQQLNSLSPTDGVPPQAINAELLKRSQMQNSTGVTAGMPALATPPAPKYATVPGTPGATPDQENFSYGSGPMPESLKYLLQPGYAAGKLWDAAAPAATTALQKAAALYQPSAPLNVVPDTAPPQQPAIPTAAAPDQSAMLAMINNIGADQPQYKAPQITQRNPADYVKALKDALPDRMSGVADALQKQIDDNKDSKSTPLAQGLMSAGLSMLASRGNYFNALGNAGQAGLKQYNEQYDANDKTQQQMLRNQLALAQAQGGQDQYIQGAAVNQANQDTNTAYQNAQLQLATNKLNADPRLAAQAMKAQLSFARLGQQGNPNQDSADKIATTIMSEGAKSIMPGDPTGDAKMQAIQNYAMHVRAAILAGQDPSRIPPPQTAQPNPYQRR